MAIENIVLSFLYLCNVFVYFHHTVCRPLFSRFTYLKVWRYHKETGCFFTMIKKRILVGILNLRFLQCLNILDAKYQRYKKLFFWILGDTKVLSWQFNMQLIQLFCRNTQIKILRQLLKPGYICICLFFCMQMISYREISKKLLLSISENCKGKLCGGIFKFFWNLQKQ